MALRFEYDAAKAHQAILWFLHTNAGTMDLLKLVKLVFLADREHLIRYGRPIVGGVYYAMKLGPVSSETLDDLNGRSRKRSFRRVGNNVEAEREVDADFLSETDREVLEYIHKTYGHLTPLELVDTTHEFRAYRKNFTPPGERFPLPYEDIFEDLDKEAKKMLDLIRESQEAFSVLE